MIKKIFLLFLIFSFYFVWQNITFTFANTTKEQQIEQNKQTIAEKTKLLQTTPQDSVRENLSKEIKTLESTNQSLQTEIQRDANCAASWDCIDKDSFMIDTSLFSAWWKWLKQENSQATINYTLGSIIQKLMIALWVISLLIMTIGAWYIILYHGEDEYLTKWKWIFTAWIISLVIALSSYYIVNLVAYILYQ